VTSINPTAALAQRFTINWLNLADAAVPATIMAPDYQVHIGATELDGLEPYTAGTIGQLEQFPGLALTVHEFVTDGSQLALVFTEHGASAKHDGRAAAWRGVALFRCAGGLLAENWTQEDYYARRRQLATGVPDTIPAPAVAPWTVDPQPADTAAEDTVRSWLGAPVLDGVELDDGSPLTVDVTGVEVARLFSAGDAVAFAGRWAGRYAGGVDGVTGTGQPAALGICGVVHVDADRVVGGHVVTDRHGLRRSLLD